MNFGDCPYDDCDGVMFVGVPEQTPSWAWVKCDSCDQDVLYRFSRIAPMAYPAESQEGRALFEKETKTKCPEPAGESA